eukprot:scpid92475/ scgid18385/ 
MVSVYQEAVLNTLPSFEQIVTQLLVDHLANGHHCFGIPLYCSDLKEVTGAKYLHWTNSSNPRIAHTLVFAVTFSFGGRIFECFLGVANKHKLSIARCLFRQLSNSMRVFSFWYASRESVPRLAMSFHLGLENVCPSGL